MQIYNLFFNRANNFTIIFILFFIYLIINTFIFIAIEFISRMNKKKANNMVQTANVLFCPTQGLTH